MALHAAPSEEAHAQKLGFDMGVLNMREEYALNKCRALVDVRYYATFQRGYKSGLLCSAYMDFFHRSPHWIEQMPELAYWQWITKDSRYIARMYWYQMRLEIKRVRL